MWFFLKLLPQSLKPVGSTGCLCMLYSYNWRGLCLMLLWPSEQIPTKSPGKPSQFILTAKWSLNLEWEVRQARRSVAIRCAQTFARLVEFFLSSVRAFLLECTPRSYSQQCNGQSGILLCGEVSLSDLCHRCRGSYQYVSVQEDRQCSTIQRSLSLLGHCVRFMLKNVLQPLFNRTGCPEHVSQTVL